MNVTKTTKYYLLTFLTLTLFLFSCDVKDNTFDPYAQFKEDVNIINGYIEDNNLEAYNIDSSGVYISFSIQDSSTSVHPVRAVGNDTSYVTIQYKGYFADGTIFAQSKLDETVEFNLMETIVGWQIGLPEMTVGDNVTLMIPSYWGYGNNLYHPDFSNTVLFFDIYLESYRYVTE